MSKKIIQKIKDIEIQGAINIAREALLHLKGFARQNGFGSKFDLECDRLLSTRPTGVALYNVIKELRKDKSLKKINELLNKIKADEDRITNYGEKLIKNRMRVQTHCHSSRVISIIKKAAKKKKLTIISDVTEPKKQGLKTVKELTALRNVETILITDNAAGLALSPPGIPMSDIVILGADAIRRDGVVNKVGSYLIAVAAAEQGIPLYIAASTLKYDRRRRLVIEMRHSQEVCKKIKGVKILNPAFDITPWKYITGVITEDGIKKPIQVLKELKQ